MERADGTSHGRVERVPGAHRREAGSRRFTRLFRHFAPLIKAFALSGSALSATHADELVQEVMLKIWQKAGFNPEKAAASTWVYTIARNCRTDMFRRLQKFDTPLAAEDFSGRAGETRSPSCSCRASAARIGSATLMGTLPPDQMQILAKVYMEGKSHAEAAAELDLPLGTVKSRVRLAVQKLQVQFEEVGPE
jgi:RNA polymerase sigma factor (sigma-70 family)